MLAAWSDDAPASLDRFRISANAVVPVEFDGRTCYLRYAPASEQPRAQVEAEVALVEHLRARGYPAARPLPARNGAPVVEVATPWGPHVATLFEGVPGTQLGRLTLGDAVAASYGAALGGLHVAAADYRPPGEPRRSHDDALDWAERTLVGLGDRSPAVPAIAALRRRWADRPRAGPGYALVHYDFELDNVFFDASDGRCWAIDFDDTMRHWLGMDVERALASLREEAPAEALAGLRAAFLRGYATRHPLEPGFEAREPEYRRFAELYGYARVAHALAEDVPDPPEWMTRLRGYLSERQRGLAAGFGQGLPVAGA